MELPKEQVEFMNRVMEADTLAKQAELRKQIRGDAYHAYIENAYLANPFFKLTMEEAKYFRENQDQADVYKLIAARDAASRSSARNYAVFCMPKSGSSFVQSALQHALNIPFLSLTSFGTPRSSSFFGMNSREQEIDELALTKAILKSPRGFVSQNHTRYSMYLALQMRTFNITPIVTVRNILDCIVSFDEMMLKWRAGKGDHGWTSDAQFSLPLNYSDLASEARYDILSRSFGVWLINFFLSWKRCVKQNIVSPILIRYETDILDNERFARMLRDQIAMTEDQEARLRSYARTPDVQRSRFNVGVQGRGRSLIPDHIVDSLRRYAMVFRDEILDEDIAYLIG